LSKKIEEFDFGTTRRPQKVSKTTLRNRVSMCDTIRSLQDLGRTKCQTSVGETTR
jgi:hypothetical protein